MKNIQMRLGSHFSGYKFEQKFTQFMPTEIHYKPDPNARNGSLYMWQAEMRRTYHKCVLIV